MRVFIADADQELLMALQILLHQEPGMPLVGIAVRTNGLLAQVGASQPDVVLVDWYLPGRPGRDIVADLHTLERRPQIVVLSVEPGVEGEAQAAGADAFVSKGEPPDKLVAILRTMRSTPAVGTLSEDADSQGAGEDLESSRQGTIR